MCRRRFEKAENLAFEFHVSEKTVRRDIEAISRSVPIYTKQGRNGGVYLLDGYAEGRAYMSDGEIALLESLSARCKTPDEKRGLAKIIGKYSRPAA